MSVVALLFVSTFVVVFALGLQSLNVNGGHRALAFVTSFAIGASNLVLFKVLPAETSPLQIAAYLLGGPFGIVASMAAHPWLVARLRRAPAAKAAAGHVPPFPMPQPARVVATPAACDSYVELVRLAIDLQDPRQLGRGVSPEIRQRAKDALGAAHRRGLR